MATDHGPAPRRRVGDRRGAGVRRTRPCTDQAALIADAMVEFCGVGAALFAVVAAAQFAVDGRPGAWAPSTLAALTSLVLGVGFVLLRSGRGEFMRRKPLAFGLTVGALVGINPVVYVLGTHVTYPAIGMLLVIVGVGGLMMTGAGRWW